MKKVKKLIKIKRQPVQQEGRTESLKVRLKPSDKFFVQELSEKAGVSMGIVAEDAIRNLRMDLKKLEGNSPTVVNRPLDDCGGEINGLEKRIKELEEENKNLERDKIVTIPPVCDDCRFKVYPAKCTLHDRCLGNYGSTLKDEYLTKGKPNWCKLSHIDC